MVTKRPWRTAVSWLAVGLTLGSGLAWAILTVTEPAPALPAEPEYVTATSTEGSVQRVLQLNAVAQWPSAGHVVNRASGTVTRTGLDAGAQVSAGTVLYWVDQSPVIAAQGTIPAYRDLSAGATGEDVRQLEEFLAAQGAQGHTVDDRFTAATTASVRPWQRSVGLPPSGTVRVSDLVYFDALPVRASLDASVVARGRSLSGGEAAATLLAATPRFTVSLDALQAQLVQPGMGVELDHHGTQWRAVVSGLERGAQEAQVDAVLAGVDGAPVCGEECEVIPASTSTVVPARIDVVPQTTGITVPSAAIHSDASGATLVSDVAGEDHAVHVVASRGGISVVEGLDAGVTVRLPRSP